MIQAMQKPAYENFKKIPLLLPISVITPHLHVLEIGRKVQCKVDFSLFRILRSTRLDRIANTPEPGLQNSKENQEVFWRA
jgi:hypothetical protein